MELAHALRATGQLDEARRIVQQEQPWECWHYATDQPLAAQGGPWEQSRVHALRESARVLCPPEADRALPSGG
ncbi:MAG: hypothetical protein IPL03_18250 [Sterolibacteriaceae bacterium]|jgi:hypothetical protein|nr:hypothetical protein [Candidatus Methylophosphatis haderslevensis]